MSANPRSLNDLRQEIDAIDLQLHKLIQQRGGLAAEISEIKNRDGLDKVRPGREAILLRGLMERHEGNFPVGAILRIWRELISSLVLMELPEYAVAVYAPEGEHGYWDLARDQFGSQTPMSTHPSARDAIARLFDGKATIAVVPYPTEDEPGNWWTNLCTPTGPRIIYRLPFFGKGSSRGRIGDASDALGIGQMMTEETGDDRTVLVLETGGDLSRSGVAEILTSCELLPILLAPETAGAELCYCEVEGFVKPQDVRLKLLKERSSIERLSVIGHYATPMRLPKENWGLTSKSGD